MSSVGTILYYRYVSGFNHIVLLFTPYTVGLMSTLWISDATVRKWILCRPYEIFRDKYDTVTEQLEKISCMDDLLSGVLLLKAHE